MKGESGKFQLQVCSAKSAIIGGEGACSCRSFSGHLEHEPPLGISFKIEREDESGDSKYESAKRLQDDSEQYEWQRQSGKCCTRSVPEQRCLETPGGRAVTGS